MSLLIKASSLVRTVVRGSILWGASFVLERLPLNTTVSNENHARQDT
jgi:hypothetical protein